MSTPYHPPGCRYVADDEIDALLAPLPGLAAFRAAGADARVAALCEASLDVDSAMPYHGRRYAADQPLAFPRLIDDADPATADNVWSWEDGESVVPADVKTATLYQADTIVSGTREPRLAAEHDGVVYEQTGGLAESYKATPGPGVPSGLCRRAYVLMRTFRLRSGRLA